MLQTLGKMPTGKPPAGFFKAVHFPQLMLLDQETGDGRLIESAGAGTRNLPLSIRAQFASTYGHSGAVVTGSLFEVTIDPEGGVMSGDGFLLDDENGRQHAKYIHLQAMRGNSVDLADCKIVIKWKSDDPSSPDYFEYTIIFTKANLAATTGVGTPAFADARAELPGGMTDEELMASLGDPMEPLVCEFDSFTYNMLVPPPAVTREQAAELMAAGIVQKRETFFRPESEIPHKIIVHEDLTISGHLALWNTCHEGIEGQCVIPPRPQDGYASHNQPGVLTDRGIVETGPIFFLGGHRKIGGKTREDAYGGIENSWADVRVTEGVHGPWLSGVVRPGVGDEEVYKARASRISGHWIGNKLRAIVSVNVAAYNVPGSGEMSTLERDLVAGFAAHVSDDGVSELVASFPHCDCHEQAASDRGDVHVHVGLGPEDRDDIVARVLASLNGGFATFTTETTTETIVETVVDEVLVTIESNADDLLLADLLEQDFDEEPGPIEFRSYRP